VLLARHRRPLAALSAALAVAAGVAAARPPTPPSTPVLVAARDLDTGAVPGPGDLRTVRLPPGAVPDHALRRPEDTHGRTLAAGVRRGEPITDVRLVGPQLRGSPGSVALPVRFADADAARLLRPGDRVDVLAGPQRDAAADTGGPAGSATASHASVIARDTTVLTRPAGEQGGEGGLLILAVAPEAATAIAGAAASAPLTYMMRSTLGDTVATESH
jgi:Flp pilus assembly protein CpaB